MSTTRSRLRCVFRVAAGPRLGFGHLLRLRALARALGVVPRFSVRGGKDATEVARRMGCRVVRGTSAVRRADLLALDDPSPLQARRWAAVARRHGIPCISVHDGTRALKVDLVVDGSIRASARRVTASRLAGIRFCILDQRIKAARKPRRRRLRGHAHVLIALGGGDHVRRIAQRVVDEVGRRNSRVSIAVAPGFVRRPRTPLRRARWLPPQRRLIKPLLDCDVALVAGGVTLYEACALGVPAVGLAVVQSQRSAIISFARLGAILDAGGPPGSVAAIKRASAKVARLLADDGLRREIAAIGRGLVDGGGASRVARRIVGTFAPGGLA